jgi:hypothetical protein
MLLDGGCFDDVDEFVPITRNIYRFSDISSISNPSRSIVTSNLTSAAPACIPWFQPQSLAAPPAFRQRPPFLNLGRLIYTC